MRTSVIIVGGGFGGLEAAFMLISQVDAATEITMIDRSRFHSFIPSIHEIISGKIEARSIQIPLDTVLTPAGVRFALDHVREIDTMRHHVVTDNDVFAYDYLVLAPGAQSNFFNVPGAEKYSYHFRSPEDANRLHSDLVSLLQRHERPLHLVLAGGGTEGVEGAGEILDLVHDRGYGDDLVEGRIAITILERQQQILPDFPPSARDFAQQYLRDRSVNLMTGHCVIAVQEHSLDLESGRTIPYSMLIWTGGIKPPQIIERIALPKEPPGWLIVTDGLQCPSDDRIFGIGDAVSIHNDNGALKLPRLAYHAQDEGVVAALNIAYHLRGRRLIRYIPQSKPQLISIGRSMGIFTYDDWFRAGAWVVAMKKAIERKHLLSSLSRPLFSRIPFRVPGADLLKRIKLHLPF